MKVSRILTKIIVFIYYLYRFRNYRLAFDLSNTNVPLKKCTDIVRRDDYLFSNKTNNKMAVHTINKFFSKEVIYVLELLNSTCINDIEERDNSLIVNVNGVLLNIHSVSNIATFYEIFVKRMYDYYSSLHDIIVVDIGMNVGFASLFFASMRNVRKVYSFEPFVSTFNTALKNFEYNPFLKEKIKPCNKGISNQTKYADVPLFEDDSPIASTNIDFINTAYTNTQQRKTVQIELIDIIEILKNILHEEGKISLILKIDCEGEEYNIIDRINEGGLLNNISAFLIEWHYKGADDITNTLVKNDFQVFHSTIVGVDGTLNTQAGIIYAFK